ncbi:THO complex subunit 6-like protein [Armadillidium nasatum]|uniref:THO complex subunit 6-like protein n=1 Tax=Armadillidium nasatum TaxID=96803 RepID=A0A5N5T8A9_9CRUS|nr:THO complex subunit 6-like protein [Armadillidium nasatum]
MIFSALKDIYSKIYCLSSSTNETLLSVGNSDGKLIIFDIKELMPQKGIVGREKLNKPVLTISAHNDPIYSMASSKEFCITGATGVISVYSAGEDGQVLVWDPRVGREPKIKLKPYTNEQIQRPQFGKYITSVDVENDWLICGGGPQAGIFHLRSLALTTVFEPKETSIHVTKFTRQGFDRGSIVVAGASSQVNVCNISGEITAKILASSSCVYDVHVLEHPNTIAFIGGTGVKTGCMS